MSRVVTFLATVKKTKIQNHRSVKVRKGKGIPFLYRSTKTLLSLASKNNASSDQSLTPTLNSRRHNTITNMEPPSPPPPPPPLPPKVEYRMEHDLIGDEQVPKDAYYGIQTQRA
jgi:hypothetical protein